MVKRSLKTVW